MSEQPENPTLDARFRMDAQMAAAIEKMAEISAELGDVPANPSPEEARTRMLAERRFWNEDPVSVAAVEDIAVPGPFRDVPVRVYRPAIGEEVRPAIIHFHGGGWVKGSPESHDRIGRVLAAESGAVVFSVDYALAPEHKFPAPLEECVAAVLAVRDSATTLAIDPGRVALAGDSAGGNLALAAALDLRAGHPGLVKALLLFYGVFDSDLNTESYLTFGADEFELSRDDMAAYWDAYGRNVADRDNPRAAPMKADLTGMPPMHLCAAGLDVLRDDTLNLAKRLSETGAPFELKRYEGVCHAFVGLGRVVKAGDAAIAAAAAFARKIFETD